jgi:hypothetical protein
MIDFGDTLASEITPRRVRGITARAVLLRDLDIENSPFYRLSK